jgi:hypothetical protein
VVTMTTKVTSAACSCDTVRFVLEYRDHNKWLYFAVTFIIGVFEFELWYGLLQTSVLVSLCN